MFASRLLTSMIERTSERWKQIQALLTSVSVSEVSESSFDNFSRSVGSQMNRRDVLKVSFLGMFSVLFGGLGLKEAWAAADCLCGGQLYDPATGCCTPTGVKPKYPIANLDSCPNRVAHSGYTCVPNGCGASGGQSFPGSFGAASFISCCNGHDCCWGNCNNDRNDCDNGFLACLQASCDAAYPSTSILNKIKNGTCRATASSYFLGVQTDKWGTPAYVAAQQAACDCCGAEPCKTCPGGSCGALPSCQDPGCVCFQTIEGKGFCHLPQSCTGLANCSSTASCPSGWACVSVTCCGPNPICIRPCFVVGVNSVSTLRATRNEKELTTAGFQ